MDCRGLIVERSMMPTLRQVEALKLASDGLTNKEIAQKLGLSEQTVKNHFSALYFKLGVHERARAVARVLQ